MKFDGEIMEILAAYDLTGSLRAAAALAGCSHHTVQKHVAARDAGRPIAVPVDRDKVTDAFLPKIEEWVEASGGKIRADKAHPKLVALGFEGSERSTRRAIAQVRAAWRLGHVRVHGHGSPNLVSGCNTTSATALSSMDERPCCSSLGWRGRGLGS